MYDNQTGTLHLPSGAKIPIEYKLAASPDGLPRGSLFGAMDVLDPRFFAAPIVLECDNGIVIDILITYQNTQYASFIGTKPAATI